MPAVFYPEGSKQPQWAKGETHYCAKLKEADVREIRASTVQDCLLAKEYNVSPVTIHFVKTRKRWRHVT